MTGSPPDAAAPADRFAGWLFDVLLPFWAKAGVDRDAGGFHERLDRDRNPVVSDGKRVMVQARQVATFAQAALLDRLPAGRDLARFGGDFLREYGRHRDGGWRFRTARDGAPVDDTRDLYTHAFVLYALAWLHRLEGDGAAAGLAADTVAFLDGTMAHPRGGYYEAADGDRRSLHGTRRQNPHMHLFEAFLEWYAATGEATWLARAEAIGQLLRDRFCVDGTLREYFDDRLAPLPGADGRHVEPGHHYEWAWLLRRYATLGDDDTYAALAKRLYAFAEAHGVDAATGGIVDAVDPDGTMTRRSRRLWPQTEAIRAHIAQFEATGDAAPAGRLAGQAAALWHTHIAGAPDGAWREHLAEDGALLVSDLPASSLYHLTLAAAELVRRPTP